MNRSGFVCTAFVCTLWLAAPVSAVAAGWLGVGAGPVRGVEVREVVKDGPADKAGLHKGDVVLKVGDQEVRDLAHFLVMVSAGKPGEEAVLTIQREGSTQEVRTRFDDSSKHGVLPVEPGAEGGEGSPLDFRRGGVAGYYPGAMLPPGHSHDIHARMISVKSLLEAYDRIRIEKKLADSNRTGDRIRELLAKAEEAQRQYKLDEGYAAVEEAYVLARDGLKSLREGETLVSALTFRTPKDEFDYEINRNNMVQLLVRGLPDGGKALARNPEIKQAVKLRKEAEKSAKGNLARAIQQLEESSNLYLRALTGSELDIPPELKP